MAGSFQLFNLETMSGVFPGTRTMVFQRVRLRAAESAARAGDEDGGQAPSGEAGPLGWVRLLWYEEPAACVVELRSTLIRIPEPLAGDFVATVQAALEVHEHKMQACGSCAFWQPLTARTADGLPVGRCTWRGVARGPDVSAYPDDVGMPAALTVQSCLALDCSHWRAGEYTGPVAAAEEDLRVEPIAKHAEQETDARWSWWGRLRRRFGGQGQEEAGATEGAGGPAQSVTAGVVGGWAARVMERSGVGAGTERCFACQGRIANLGALAVASPEGDKQTYSVWRCRQCFTYYLNDWIDRWERTDSLETEERYYRLAPAEALEILAVIDNVVNAEHPARRHERGAERAWMLQYLGARPPLSHQIKQGR